MAEIVDKFPGRQVRIVTYPWAEWSDGKIRKLTLGVDFYTSTVQGFQNIVNQWAARHGKNMITRSDGDDVYIQCTGTRY